MALLDIRNLSREFGLGKSVVKALDDVSLRLEAGGNSRGCRGIRLGKIDLARIVMALDLRRRAMCSLTGKTCLR